MSIHPLDPKLQSLLAHIKLPDAPIVEKGEVSKQFLSKNISTFYDAIEYVYKLPYAPPSEPFNFHLVLKEGRGTCSTRHALLVALAKELDLPINLGLAIYNLTPERFPALKDILQKFNIPYIPESHNFMVYNDKFLDITFPGDCKRLSSSGLSQVEIILPEQIMDYKVDVYKKYLEKWYQENDFSFSMEEFNEAHRQCIAKLGEGVMS
jgi:hypothetical protein